MLAPSQIKKVIIDTEGPRICTKGPKKYLGVWMERGGRCGRHIEYMSEKAARRTHAIAQMLNTDGPVMERARRVYASVILSWILCAVPAWYGLVRSKKEIIAAGPTVSTTAAEVISSQSASNRSVYGRVP